MTVSPTDNQEITSVDAEESNSVNQGSDAGSPSATEGADADSPPAQGSKKESLVDRIKKATDAVVEGKSPDPKEGDDGEAAKAEGEENPEEAEEKPFTKDDLNGLHSKTRKRVGKLIATLDTVTKERDQFKPAAEQYSQVIGFLKENGLSMDDANQAFDIMRDIQHDPERALAALEPIVEQLRQATGSVLPPDLAAQVQQGYITEAHAQELSKHRAKNAHQSVKAEHDRENFQRQRVETAQKATKDIVSSISDWESKWASADPDYQKLRDDVRDELELSLSRAHKAGKLPRTAQDAVKFAEDCKKRVISKLGKFQPPRKEIRHVTGSSAPSAKPAAKSMQEAILNAANG